MQRKTKIIYVKFDNNEIEKNEAYYRLMLKIKNPLESRGETVLKGVDLAIDSDLNFYEWIGNINSSDPEEAYQKCQNNIENNGLDDRSMAIGDIILYDDEGFVCESYGFSKLNADQLKYFKGISDDANYDYCRFKQFQRRLIFEKIKRQREASNYK